MSVSSYSVIGIENVTQWKTVLFKEDFSLNVVNDDARTRQEGGKSKEVPINPLVKAKERNFGQDSMLHNIFHKSCSRTRGLSPSWEQKTVWF